jgi:hypothetical protein
MRFWLYALVLFLPFEAKATCISIYGFFCGHNHDALAKAEVMDFHLSDDGSTDAARFRVLEVLTGTTETAGNDEVEAVGPNFFVSPLYTEVGSHYLIWLQGSTSNWGRLLDDVGHVRFPSVDLSLEDVASAASVEPYEACVAALSDLGVDEPPCNDTMHHEIPPQTGSGCSATGTVDGLTGVLALGLGWRRRVRVARAPHRRVG